MAGQDGITHVYAAELPDEETEIVPFRGRESYILSEWELETEGKLEQAAMVKTVHIYDDTAGEGVPDDHCRSGESGHNT